MAEVKCMNPYDCQSKRIYDIDGVYRTLDAGNAAGGQAHGICYAIDKQDESLTEITCFQASGDRANPSISISKIAYCIPANPMSDRGQAVCYAIDQQGGKSNAGYAEDVMMTILSDSHGTPHGVCYIQESVGRTDCETTDGNVIAFKEREGRGMGGKGIMTSIDMAFTLPTFAENKVCYSIEGNVVDRNAGQNGKGWAAGYAPTLNQIDRHAVCYGVDCRNATLDRERTHTIQAKPGGGVSANCTPSVLMEKKHEDREDLPDPEPPTRQPGDDGGRGHHPDAERQDGNGGGVTRHSY